MALHPVPGICFCCVLLLVDRQQRTAAACQKRHHQRMDQKQRTAAACQKGRSQRMDQQQRTAAACQKRRSQRPNIATCCLHVEDCRQASVSNRVGSSRDATTATSRVVRACEACRRHCKLARVPQQIGQSGCYAVRQRHSSSCANAARGGGMYRLSVLILSSLGPVAVGMTVSCAEVACCQHIWWPFGRWRGC